MSRKNGGTTTVELLMSLSLLIVAALGLVSLLSNAAKLNKNGMDQTFKLCSAQQKLDELTLANATIGTVFTDSQKDFPLGASFDCYRRWKGLPDPAGNLSIQIVQVDIVWTDGRRGRQISLFGMVAP